MAENNTGILEELKKATEQVQKVAEMEAKEQAAYKEAVAKQFFELQKAVHSIISEEGIILKNFKWQWIDSEKTEIGFDCFIENKAKLFAQKYGFSEECVRRILKTRNSGVVFETRYHTSYYMLVPKE